MPSFDERKFGFASLVNLLRACQRDGLFRIERDRQGVMRLFPGNVMQVPVEDGPVRRAATSRPGRLPEAAPPEWRPSESAEADVVEADVVQEIAAPVDVLDGEAATPPAESEAGSKRAGALPGGSPTNRSRRRRSGPALGRLPARSPGLHGRHRRRKTGPTPPGAPSAFGEGRRTTGALVEAVKGRHLSHRREAAPPRRAVPGDRSGCAR